MARIRSIHPSLFTDESWVTCSPLARLLYVGLMTDADDQGLFEWKPLQIKMRLLAGDAADVPALLAELVAVNLIAQLEAGGKKLGAIRYFRRFQRPKKPNAIFVLPAEWVSYVGLDVPSSEPDTDEGDAVPNQFPTGGEKSPQMEDGGGRKEEKVSDAIASSVAAGDDESDFEALWSAYPHFRGRSSKPKSRKAFWQTAPAERGGLAAAAARFKASGKLPPSGAAALEKWVEDERWRDWVDRAPVHVPTWGGPPAIRTAVGDEFATKYLDSCGWDAEAGAILAPRDFTVTQFERLSAQRRRLLSEAGVATIRVEHRERAA